MRIPLKLPLLFFKLPVIFFLRRLGPKARKRRKEQIFGSFFLKKRKTSEIPPHLVPNKLLLASNRPLLASNKPHLAPNKPLLVPNKPLLVPNKFTQPTTTKIHFHAR